MMAGLNENIYSYLIIFKIFLSGVDVYSLSCVLAISYSIYYNITEKCFKGI